MHNRNATAEQCQVVVIDAHPLTLVGVHAVLHAQHDMSVVGSAQEIAAALPLVDRACPDIVLLDLELTTDPSTELVAALRTNREHTTVVTLSDDSEKVVDALRAGARGFVQKRNVPAELVSAIRQARAGSVPVSPQALTHLVSEVQSPGRPPTLSRREIEVLHLVADGLSNDRIGEKLYISTSTVKTHIQRTFRKLDVNDRAAAVAVGLTSGFLDGDRSRRAEPLRSWSRPPGPRAAATNGHRRDWLVAAQAGRSHSH